MSDRASATRRVALATFVGTALEWYDYFLFGTAASLVFNRLYFTTLDPVSATLAAFAAFGVGFVARPVGAVLFGWMGDRIGRKPALLISVALIGAATGCIGLLPDYALIGIAAPVLLVLLRLAQGIAVGGEWGGAITLAVEHAPAHQRGWYAAIPQLGSPVGSLAASGAFALVLTLPAESFDSWGWRLPFLAAFPLLMVAVYIRRKVEESPVFAEGGQGRASQSKVPVLEVLRSPGTLGIAIASALLGIAGYHILTTFALNYGVNVVGHPRELMINAIMLSALAEIVLIILIGRLVDRVGPARVTIWGSLLCAVAALPVFLMLGSHDVIIVAAAISLGIGIATITYAVSGALLTQLFPPRVRYSGVSLAYNVAGAIAGFTPLLATSMTGIGGHPAFGPALLLGGVALISAVGGWLSLRVGAALKDS